jgi:hypothetical protein
MPAVTWNGNSVAPARSFDSIQSFDGFEHPPEPRSLFA